MLFVIMPPMAPSTNNDQDFRFIAQMMSLQPDFDIPLQPIAISVRAMRRATFGTDPARRLFSSTRPLLPILAVAFPISHANTPNAGRNRHPVGYRPSCARLAPPFPFAHPFECLTRHPLASQDAPPKIRRTLFPLECPVKSALQAISEKSCFEVQSSLFPTFPRAYNVPGLQPYV